MRFLHYSLIVVLMFSTVAHCQWEPPANYYANVNGTGPILKMELADAMASGHIQARFGDFRFSASLHDQDLSIGTNICLVYNNASVPSAWDSGVTWNREHIWPQSRQPGSASNSSTGNLGDPHALRPSAPSINSSRGNDPFGFSNTIGTFGPIGSFWFPGDVCKGDIARSLFYSDTRWSSLGLSLVNGTPSGNQMGDLESLIAWHFQDPPSEFERRRNHVIYSSELNPDYFTNNRNAFVDHPEYVWSVYVDQSNDSMITLDGGRTFSDGSSVLDVDFGEIVLGEIVDTSLTVNFSKVGMDGTYFSVSSTDSASTDREGRFNVFPLGAPASETLNVTLDYNPDILGTYTGSIVIDNLDVTIQGGVGRGANDGDDVINLSIRVVDQFVVGDINCDGLVNLLDVQPFVNLISQGIYSEKADINEDGVVNLLDVDGFVELLTN